MIGYSKPVLSFSVSADPADALFTTRLYLISFYRLYYRQSLPIRPSERYSESQPIRSRIWLCFSPLSISGQIDWHAWLTFCDSANTCPRIPVCWFLRQHNYCSSLFPRTFWPFMSIRTLSQKIGTLRNCLPCAINKNYQNNKKLFPPSTNQKEYDLCVTIRWWLYWLLFWWWQVCNTV